MKKKSIFKKLLISSMLLFTPMLTSCDMFFGGGLVIKEITHVHDDILNVTVVTITFEDEETPPVTFTIPDGVQGISIVSVTAEPLGDIVRLTITFSDPIKMPTMTVDVPIINGEDGRGIKNISITPVDGQEGVYEVIIHYTDNTQSEPFYIADGKDGEDGVGIERIDITTDPFGNTVVKFILTDGTESDPFVIYKAATIQTVTFNPEKSNETTYYFTITFTDGSTTEFSMPAPANGEDGENGSTWHCQNRSPLEDDGVDGDFWLNIGTGDVYHKVEGAWTHIFKLALDNSGEVEEVYCDVIFHLNQGSWVDASESGYRTVVQYNYLSLSRFPDNPVKTGYEFVGWYTSVDDINSGKLTDLTTITKDLHVYARWE